MPNNGSGWTTGKARGSGCGTVSETGHSTIGRVLLRGWHSGRIVYGPRVNNSFSFDDVPGIINGVVHSRTNASGSHGEPGPPAPRSSLPAFRESDENFEAGSGAANREAGQAHENQFAFPKREDG